MVDDRNKGGEALARCGFNCVTSLGRRTNPKFGKKGVRQAEVQGGQSVSTM